MKRNILKTIPSLLPVVAALLCCGAAEAAYNFASDSRLASGKWVKVFTTESGIYDISYDELREMGFANPEAVSVFGKGGAPLPATFTNRSGTPQMTDDLSAVPVHHTGDRLYFYGVGTESVSFDSSDEDMPCFGNENPNIYSLKGAYFLTDSEPEMMMQTYAEAGSNPVLYTSGYDYVLHELDLQQNNTGTGQVYWGESLLHGNTELKWKVNLPYMDPNGTMLLDCRIYASKLASGLITYGIEEYDQARKSFEIVRATNSTFRYQKDNRIFFSPDQTYPEVTVTLASEDPSGVFINLDYWMISYSKAVPDFSEEGLGQQRLFIPTWTRSQSYVPLPSGSNLMVFDVTDARNPRHLTTVERNGVTRALFSPTQAFTQLIFCNPEERQKQISGYEHVENSNLHALQREATDLLIITVPYMREYAEQIADLHRRYDGIKVSIVEPQQVYNEFSGGIPDPMAYRGIIKMIYQSENSLKNTLFLGPNYGNFREALTMGKPEGIIGYQEPVVSAERHAAHAMDFYGLTDDYIHTTSIQEDAMNVGIGLLPISVEADARTMVKKIENYLTRTDFADISNEFLSVGCAGDNHTHDFQAVEIADYVQEYVPGGWVSTVLCHDAYGINVSKRKFLEDLDRGKLITYYHGHGTSFQVPGTYDFLTGAEVANMKNTHTGLIYLGGCDLTLTDHGRPGIGELIVTGSPHGAIGAITASRTTWSGQNYDLSKRISTAFFYSRKNNLRTETPTMGEVFASAKSANSYANELCYNLIGDPAIKIPVPLCAIKAQLSSATARGGEKIKISGIVTNREGEPMTDFSGDLVIKLMAPKYVSEPANYITGKAFASSDPDKKLLIKYVDTRLEAYRAEVKNGCFTTEILLPEEVSVYTGDPLPLFLSSYSSEKNLAASGSISFTAAPLPENFDGDPSAPVITAEYNNYLRVVDVTVSDNISLDRNCLSAEGDGRKLNVILLSDDEFDLNRRYRIVPDGRLTGNHSMTLHAVDRFGNETVTEFSYSITGHEAPINIEVPYKAVTDKAQFIASETEGALTLVIEDASGREVLKEENFSGVFNWDLKDSNGTPQHPGLYRVKLESPVDPSVYSGWETFAILE